MGRLVVERGVRHCQEATESSAWVRVSELEQRAKNGPCSRVSVSIQIVTTFCCWEMLEFARGGNFSGMCLQLHFRIAESSSGMVQNNRTLLTSLLGNAMIFSVLPLFIFTDL
jgi:hypothetical protein